MKASDDTAHHNGPLTQKATESKHTRDQGNAKSTSHQIAKQLDTFFFWKLDTFFFLKSTKKFLGPMEQEK